MKGNRAFGNYARGAAFRASNNRNLVKRLDKDRQAEITRELVKEEYSRQNPGFLSWLFG